ncbi:hypothetical protein FQR65_LT16480 [Abscondita terminalis]|nr:hypothetical protein FQR65_LT16480 [Abscondita terminalis]
METLRTANELETLLNAGKLDRESIQVSWKLLLSKYDELKIVHNEVYELLLESATEAELDTDVENRNMYIKKFTVLKVKYNTLSEDSATERSTHTSSVGKPVGKRKFKLHRIEFKHYDDSVKDWLAFWDQLIKDPKDLVALSLSMFLPQEYGLPDYDAVHKASLYRRVHKIQTLLEEL